MSSSLFKSGVVSSTDSKNKNNIFFIISITLCTLGIAYQFFIEFVGIPIQVFVAITFSILFLSFLSGRNKLECKTVTICGKKVFFYIMWASCYFFSMQFFIDANKVSMFGFKLSKTAMFVFTLSLFVFSSILYLRTKNTYALKKLAYLLVSVLVINSLLSIRVLIINPSIIRDIAGRVGDTTGISINTIGVGGYPIVYAVAILFPLFVGSISMLKGRQKMLFISISIILLIYVFMSLLATAMIVMLLGTLLVAFFRLSKTKKVLVTPLIIFLLVILVNTNLLIKISLDAASMVDIPKYKEKLNDIANSLYTDEATGTVEGRAIRYKKSIDAFSNNPIIGVGFLKDKSFSIGGHATILDTFGLFGLFGGIPLLLFIYYCYSDCIRRWRNSPYITQIKVCYINFIIIAALKSIMSSYTIFLAMVLFIPIIPYYIEHIRLSEQRNATNKTIKENV